MKHIELLSITDVMRIFAISKITVYRWVSAARQGKHRFPLPIGDSKQQLRWNATDIEAYCQSRGTPQSSVKIVSPSKQLKKRQQRQEVANAILLKHGITVNSN